MAKVMKGQMNIFDQPKENRKPCEYMFYRYIGQKVLLRSGVEGIVVGIDSYYTTVKTAGGLRVGTPTTTAPVDKEDYFK